KPGDRLSEISRAHRGADRTAYIHTGAGSTREYDSKINLTPFWTPFWAMFVTFKTRAHSDITMFGEVALKLIRLMRRRDTMPSAMNSDDIPAALTKLRSALAYENSAEPDGAVTDEDDDERVSIQTRAMPLVELLVAAEEDQVPVMWEEGARKN
ncbi:MAG: DUF1840 domain-containing protein, partial [Gammaproteobacteria bacterium]|nr:DUF1840 domain-containing protein [Gammaproteobacteria bacterium]